MSVDINTKLFAVATARCKELRRNSTEAEKILWEILRNRKLLNHVTQNITLNCNDLQVVELLRKNLMALATLLVRMGLKPGHLVLI